MPYTQDIPIHPVKHVDMPRVQEELLNGSVAMYISKGSSEPVMHLDFIFNAGRAQNRNPVVASATAALLPEGTQVHSGGEIAEKLEYLGSTLKCRAGMDAISVSLYCLKRNFRESLELVTEILTQPVFTEVELRTYRRRKMQDLKISMQQNEYLANLNLSRQIFGNHPYGTATTPELLQSVTRDDILEHYELIGTSNLTLYASGQIDDEEIRLLEGALQRIPAGRKAKDYSAPDYVAPIRYESAGPQKFQAAIRLARQVGQRRHPDYPGLFFLNTLFGGYFGSRLMKNIREDKGLTYHIYSGLETLAKNATLVIGTESASRNKDVVMREIESEIEKLRNTPPSADEMEMVRNYIMGNVLMQLDGPFRTIDLVKTLVMEGESLKHLERFTDTILNITSEELQNLAVTYLDFEDMHKVVIG